MVHEPMTDLILLMSKLVSPDGNILIPGVQELVPRPTEEEKCELPTRPSSMPMPNLTVIEQSTSGLTTLLRMSKSLQAAQ
jgi:hypothetical protein